MSGRRVIAGRLFLHGSDRVDAFAHEGPDVDVVQGKPGEIPCEDLNVGTDVRAAVQNKTALAPHHAQAAFAAIEFCVGDRDVQAFGESFEFLQELGVGHNASGSNVKECHKAGSRGI